jgi:phage regulator Rha-like protein
MNQNSNTNLIEIIDDELRISHRIIAKQTENKEETISRLIRNYHDKLELFGQVSFQIKHIKNSAGAINKQKTYFLNEKQIGFLFLQAKIPLELSILFVKYGSSFKALKEFLQIEHPLKKYFVYIVDFENANLKIGFTSSPEQRLRTLETQSGNQICNKKIVEFSLKQEALAYEKFLHSRFSDFRTRGEYFSIKFNIVLDFVENLKKSLDLK